MTECIRTELKLCARQTVADLKTRRMIDYAAVGIGINNSIDYELFWNIIRSGDTINRAK